MDERTDERDITRPCSGEILNGAERDGIAGINLLTVTRAYLARRLDNAPQPAKRRCAHCVKLPRVIKTGNRKTELR